MDRMPAAEAASGGRRVSWALRLLAMAAIIVVALAGCSGGASPPDQGDDAPGFTLLDAAGRSVTLQAALANREAVAIVFYRGYF